MKITPVQLPAAANGGPKFHGPGKGPPNTETATQEAEPAFATSNGIEVPPGLDGSRAVEAHGKSAESTAHRAYLAYAAEPSAFRNFGDAVSQVARGLIDLLAAPDLPTGDGAGDGATAAGEEAAPVETNNSASGGAQDSAATGESDTYGIVSDAVGDGITAPVADGAVTTDADILETLLDGQEDGA